MYSFHYRDQLCWQGADYEVYTVGYVSRYQTATTDMKVKEEVSSAEEIMKEKGRERGMHNTHPLIHGGA